MWNNGQAPSSKPWHLSIIAFDLKMVQKLAPKYPNTRFFRVFVENIPWLVEKLFIKVLPCVICFVDGIAKDRYDFCNSFFVSLALTEPFRLVGFEELGNEDQFTTGVLELRLSQSSELISIFLFISTFRPIVSPCRRHPEINWQRVRAFIQSIVITPEPAKWKWRRFWSGRLKHVAPKLYYYYTHWRNTDIYVIQISESEWLSVDREQKDGNGLERRLFQVHIA